MLLIVLGTPLVANQVPGFFCLVLSVDSDLRVPIVVNEIPDMITIQVESFLARDFIGEVEHGILCHGNSTVPPTVLTETLHVFVKLFATTKSDEFDPSPKGFDIDVEKGVLVTFAAILFRYFWV